jgi:DNA replication protein DnaC
MSEAINKDFRDSQGLLHCGVCGAYLEHVLKCKLDWLNGRVVRVVCNCDEEKRKEFEKNQKKLFIKENKQRCFGKLPRLFDYTFELDNNKMSKASLTTRKYANEFKKYRDAGWGLVLCGGVGHGKTYYACAVANKLLQDGYKVKFTTVTEIANTANRYYISVESVVEGICEDFDIVILDDFGTEETSARMQAMTYQIINSFYNRKIPLLITSNVSRDEFKNPSILEAKRIYSRVLELATLITVDSGVGDRRLAGIKTEGA